MRRGEIASLAADAGRRFGGALALTLPGSRSLTFVELDDLAGRFAAGLRRLGVGPGVQVVLYLPNGWEWIVAYHAIARLGAVVVQANILLSGEEVTFIASDSRASVLITTLEKSAALSFGNGVRVVTLGGGPMEFGSLLRETYLPPVDVSTEDLFTIGYTSGTTGRPKGAMLTHRCVFTSLAATATTHVRHPGDYSLFGSALPACLRQYRHE
jgi:long-chain acyl-CoA synthetase